MIEIAYNRPLERLPPLASYAQHVPPMARYFALACAVGALIVEVCAAVEERWRASRPASAAHGAKQKMS